MPDKQQTLQDIHEHMKSVAQLWVSGLITDKEIAASFASHSDDFCAMQYSGAIEGLIDPNSGLRYGPNSAK